jgi:probable HAF family extracellular repeat protein
MKQLSIFAVSVLSLPVMAWAQAASNGAWTDIGSLGSGNALANGVSADGGVVTGISSVSGGLGGAGDRGFRWTAAGGMVDIDTTPNDGVVVRPYGISADGITIAGYYGQYPECNPSCAFWWTPGTGFEWLSNLPGGWYAPTTQGVSKDGSVLVGTADILCPACGNAAWLWTSSNGLIGLGTLPGASNAGALAVSEDGTVVVGWANDKKGRTNPFRWTQTTGMRSLGFLQGGNWAQATGASTNGNVVVGYGNTTQNCPSGLSSCNAAFRWTMATGMVELPILTGKAWSVTTGVSADGRTVVGYAGWNCCDWVAWRWTAATGLQSINDWLADVGVDAAGVDFYSAYAVTANGNGVAGQLNSGDAYLALVKANHAATPTYSPKPGTYKVQQQVIINDTAPTATIYYTTDGSTPTTSSTPYTGPITVASNTTIKSIATVAGYPQSPVATGVYRIK